MFPFTVSAGLSPANPSADNVASSFTAIPFSSLESSGSSGSYHSSASTVVTCEAEEVVEALKRECKELNVKLEETKKEMENKVLLR
jgi:hypothetical protein